MKIGAYLSEGALLYGNRHVFNPAGTKALKIMQKEAQIRAETPIISFADEFGFGGWTEVQSVFYAKRDYDYITIGALEPGWSSNSSQLAYYIDEVDIVNVGNPLACNMIEQKYLAPKVELIRKEADCCSNLSFLNDVGDVGIEINRIDYSLSERTPSGVYTEIFPTVSYDKGSSSFSNDHIIKFSDDICFDDNIDKHYVRVYLDVWLNGAPTPCSYVFDDVVYCEDYGCACDDIGEQIDINLFPMPREFDQKDDEILNCCYGIQINMDIADEYSCDINKIKVFVLGNSEPEFEIYPNKSNGKFTYYHAKFLNNCIILPDSTICFSPDQVDNNKTIRVQFIKETLLNGNVVDEILVCEKTEFFKVHCHCDCADIEGLELEVKESSSGGDCCYDISIVNNSDCTLLVEQINIEFFNFEVYESIVEDINSYITSDLSGVEIVKKTDNVSKGLFSFRATSSQPWILDELGNSNNSLIVATICLPVNSDDVMIELRTPSCRVGKHFLTCDLCKCKSNDYDFFGLTLKKQVKKTNETQFCYDVIVDNKGLCMVSSIDVYSLDDNDERVFEFTKNTAEGDGTFCGEVCFDESDCDTYQTIEVDVNLEENELTCPLSETFEIECTCECDENSLVFSVIPLDDGSCCYELAVNNSSLCTISSGGIEIEISKFVSGEPLINIYDEIDLSNFYLSSDLKVVGSNSSNFLIKKKNSNEEMEYPSDKTVLGTFCLPGHYDTSFNQYTIEQLSLKVSILDSEGNECSEDELIINADCNLCDDIDIQITSTMLHTGECCYEIVINNPNDADFGGITVLGPNISMENTSTYTINYCISKSQFAEVIIQFWPATFLSYQVFVPLCTKKLTLFCNNVLRGYPEDVQNPISAKRAILNLEENNVELSFNPNPANSMAVVQFEILQSYTDISLGVYDIKGKLVSYIPLDNFDSGIHAIKVDVSDIANGNYYLILSADGEISSIAIKIIK